jgi:hypothetical protein
MTPAGHMAIGSITTAAIIAARQAMPGHDDNRRTEAVGEFAVSNHACRYAFCFNARYGDETRRRSFWR